MLRDTVARSFVLASIICTCAFGPPSAMAEPPSTRLPSGSATVTPSEPSASIPQVQVQPRGSNFAPNSPTTQVIEKRITDFNEMQKIEDASFDKRLKICRGC